VPLPGVDQKHLACSDLARLRAVVEMEATARDDERDGNRIAVLGDSLAGLEAQTDHAHRTAVRDLLESESARGVAGV
jgi:hypothetical protein